MSQRQLTEEEKQRRVETARRNGAKSKGPITPEGKYRSSMNAIATGEHVELHKEDLPPFYFLLSTNDRAEYLRSFQSMLRQFKPNSEFELSLVRRMAMFLHDRLTRLGNRPNLYIDIDELLRSPHGSSYRSRVKASTEHHLPASMTTVIFPDDDASRAMADLFEAEVSSDGMARRVIESRLAILSQAEQSGMLNELFWNDAHGVALKVRPGFAFWPKNDSY